MKPRPCTGFVCILFLIKKEEKYLFFNCKRVNIPYCLPCDIVQKQTPCGKMGVFMTCLMLKVANM